MIVPPHYRPLTWPPTGSRTRFSSPHQNVSTQASKRGRSCGTMIAPPPPSERTHQSTQTPQANTGSSANTQPQPPTEQTRPQQAQAATPSANTRNAHTKTRGQNSVSAGTRGSKGRPARTKRKRPTRARRQRTQQARKQPGLRRVPSAPAREDSAREGRSQ